MRHTPLVALAALTLVLAGCTAGSPSPDGADTHSMSTDLCDAAAPSGEAAEGIDVSGEVGAAPNVDISAPLAIGGTQRTVAVAGEGPALGFGDYVSYAMAVFDANSGDVLEETGFDGATMTPAAVTQGSGAEELFGCATEGSRLVVTTSDEESGGAYVYVIDVLDVIAADEWCPVEAPQESFPLVTMEEEAGPVITIPDAAPPVQVQVQSLESGDGETVRPGDLVSVDYTGVRWSDGEVFDSNWTEDPATFATTDVVVGFQRAIEGQAVGSTVLVAMPPVCAYGEVGASSSDLAGETLVFAVHILATERGGSDGQ